MLEFIKKSFHIQKNEIEYPLPSHPRSHAQAVRNENTWPSSRNPLSTSLLDHTESVTPPQLFLLYREFQLAHSSDQEITPEEEEEEGKRGKKKDSASLSTCCSRSVYVCAVTPTRDGFILIERLFGMN